MSGGALEVEFVKMKNILMTGEANIVFQRKNRFFKFKEMKKFKKIVSN